MIDMLRQMMQNKAVETTPPPLLKKKRAKGLKRKKYSKALKDSIADRKLAGECGKALAEEAGTPLCNIYKWVGIRQKEIIANHNKVIKNV